MDKLIQELEIGSIDDVMVTNQGNSYILAGDTWKSFV
jgi:hypothetical protein